MRVASQGATTTTKSLISNLRYGRRNLRPRKKRNVCAQKAREREKRIKKGEQHGSLDRARRMTRLKQKNRNEDQKKKSA